MLGSAGLLNDQGVPSRFVGFEARGLRMGHQTVVATDGFDHEALGLGKQLTTLLDFDRTAQDLFTRVGQ
jgi:hypothetical protein